MFVSTAPIPTALVSQVIPIQAGPAYVCFDCGAPATHLAHWPTNPTNPALLDLYAAYIAYLQSPCACSPKRVAVLSGFLTPLIFASDADLPDFHLRVEANAAAVRAALAVLQVAREQAEQADAASVATIDAMEDAAWRLANKAARVEEELLHGQR